MEEKFLEMAEKFAEDERNSRIALSSKLIAPQSSPDFDGEHCIDCGNEIPSGRLEMGRIRCTGCETAVEKRNKMFAR